MFSPHLEDRGPKVGQLGLPDNSDSTVLVFVGSCLVFSDRLLRTVEFEFDEIEVLRIRDIQGLDALGDQIRLSTRLIFYDEASMVALLSTKREPDQFYRDIDKVLAYVSPEVAQNLRKKALQSKTELQMRFLPMKAPLDAWLAAFRLLILGEVFVPAELLRKSHQSPSAPDKSSELSDVGKAENPEQSQPFPNLTYRETQVLELVAGGLPNKLIADKLSLSEHTVKLHVHHVFGKLGVQNRTSATNWYFSRKDGLDGSKMLVNHGTP